MKNSTVSKSAKVVLVYLAKAPWASLVQHVHSRVTSNPPIAAYQDTNSITLGQETGVRGLGEPNRDGQYSYISPLRTAGETGGDLFPLFSSLTSLPLLLFPYFSSLTSLPLLLFPYFSSLTSLPLPLFPYFSSLTSSSLTSPRTDQLTSIFDLPYLYRLKSTSCGRSLSRSLSFILNHHRTLPVHLEISNVHFLCRANSAAHPTRSAISSQSPWRRLYHRHSVSCGRSPPPTPLAEGQ